MTKINKPTGLIRFASYNSIKDGISKLLNVRVAGYSVILIVLLSVLSFFVASRTDIEMTVLKVPGTLYQKTDDGHISNLYNIQFVNKTYEEKSVDLKVAEGSKGIIERVGGNEIIIPPNEVYEGVFFIKIPEEEVKSSRMVVGLELFSEGELIDNEDTKFIGPVSF